MYIRTFGLIPYVYHYLYKGSLIAYAVFNNGILFHVLLPNSVIVKWYDIICNCMFIMYVNVGVLNFYVFLWTCIACACFIWNSMYIKHEPSKALIHIFGVQLPLYKALTLSNY